MIRSVFVEGAELLSHAHSSSSLLKPVRQDQLACVDGAAASQFMRCVWSGTYELPGCCKNVVKDSTRKRLAGAMGTMGLVR